MVNVLRKDFVKWEPLRKLCWEFADSNKRIPLKLMLFQVCTQDRSYYLMLLQISELLNPACFFVQCVHIVGAFSWGHRRGLTSKLSQKLVCLFIFLFSV